MNVCDTLLLCHLAMICFMSSQKIIMYFVPFMQVLILLPFAVLVFVVCFRLLCKARRSLFNRSLRLTHYLPHCCLKADTDDSSRSYREPKVFRSLQSYGAIGFKRLIMHTDFGIHFCLCIIACISYIYCV